MDVSESELVKILSLKEKKEIVNLVETVLRNTEGVENLKIVMEKKSEENKLKYSISKIKHAIAV